MEKSNKADSLDEASRYLASTLHEIRTPIQTIIGNVELLQETNMDSEQREYIRQIQFSADVLLDLANNILDFTKIRSKEFKLESVPFNIVELTEQVVDLISIEAFNRGLEIITDIDFTVPSIITGDPVRIQQIILNLLKNAVKFTNKGFVHIELKKQDNFLLFKITDTGIGIKEEQKSKLFTNYYQGDISTYRKFGGTGLGLSICKNLVKLMNGKIGVDSPEEGGSCFWFTIPFSPAPEFEELSKADSLCALKNEKVLIVEDNELASSSLAEILFHAGIKNIKTVSSSQNAVEFLIQAEKSGEPFTIAFIDMLMPFIDGWHLANDIQNKKEIKNIPSLYLLVPEGQMKSEAKMKMLNWFKGYLYKPFKRKKVFELLYESLHDKNDSIDELELADDDSIAALETVDESSIAKGKKILVAEDHPVNRKLLETFLRKFGADVFLAEDGQQAVEQIQKTPEMDLIFMDIQMPVKNGIEATCEIRKNGYKGIIIACTANNDKDDFEAYKKTGINDIIVKPFKRETIRKLIDTWQPIMELPFLSAVTTLEFDTINSDQPWDKEDFLDTVSGDTNAACLILKTYIEQTDSFIEQTERAIKAQDFEVLRRIGHSLSGSSGTVSAKKLAEYGKRLNLSAKSADIPGCQFNLEEFRHEYNQFKKLVQKFIKENEHS